MAAITRQMMGKLPSQVLSRGRWGNADLICVESDGRRYVVKDFAPCPPVVKNTWGRWMVKREYRAFVRLAGIRGVPSEPFLVDAHAVGYRFIAGTTLRSARPGQIPEDFFPQLETLVRSMHERNIVHLDLRNRRNIIVDEHGAPALLDFQSFIDLGMIPAPFRPLLKDIDLSGVYKTWLKLSPYSLDPARRAHLERMNRRRRLWIFRGYPLGTKGSRRR